MYLQKNSVDEGPTILSPPCGLVFTATNYFFSSKCFVENQPNNCICQHILKSALFLQEKKQITDVYIECFQFLFLQNTCSYVKYRLKGNTKRTRVFIFRWDYGWLLFSSLNFLFSELYTLFIYFIIRKWKF